MPPTEPVLSATPAPAQPAIPLYSSQSQKLFRLKDVRAGGIVGGPWAATYFFYKNFKNSGNNKPAKITLLLGVLSPLVFIALGFIFPANTPRFVFVGLYAGLVAWLTQRYHASLTQNHGLSGGAFYSSSKATLMTVVFLVAYLVALVGFVWIPERIHNPNFSLGDTLSAIFTADKFDAKTYDIKLDQVKANDSAALQGFTTSSERPGATQQQILVAVENSLTKYATNKQLLSEMAALKYTPSVLEKQNQALQKYTDLRILFFGLVKKAVTENTNIYDAQISDLVQQIDTLLDTMEK